MLLAVMMTLMTGQQAEAADITPEEALNTARSFMTRHHKTANGRANKAENIQLKATRQVSGLYIFNMNDEGGYVIVSNDDRTLPILGFSDSGHFDPDDMPDNMKAWLQGYADEIAWMNEHHITTTTEPAKIGTHATTAIEPLIKTEWGQGVPFNDRCPRYPKTVVKAPHCLTGCVATAMAQVMNYHQWPASPTQAIPGYTWSDYIDTSADLPVISFDWQNMKNTYTGEEPVEDPTAIAVSTLMQYCGWSVEMGYGPSFSGAYTKDIATALKTYFDYDKKTTQFASRSCYSYANWTDMIYNELSQGRPVIYSGQSVAGGHSFVCDGYKYDGDEDLFHINWGWNGNKDGYFVLSVMNADEEKGYVFNYDQSAVVGIRKNGAEGDVPDYKENAITINLTVNSISLSPSTVSVGQSVTVTYNVINNSEKAYDGDLAIIIGSSLGPGQVFQIAAGATANCAITYTPRKAGEYTIAAGIPSGDGSFIYARNPETKEKITVPLTVNKTSLVLLNDDSAQPEGSKNVDIIRSNSSNTVDVTLSGRTLYKDGDWNTLCLPFSLTADQVNSALDKPTELKTLSETSFAGGTLTLTFADASSIAAGKPYIIRWNKDEGYVDDDAHNIVNPVFTDVTISKSKDIVKTTYADFIGNISPTAFEANDLTTLFLGSNNKLYYPNAIMNLDAFRAYFQLKGISVADIASTRMNLGDDNDVTGIIEAEAHSQHSALNSKLSEWFTLDGRKLDKQPTKSGLYIYKGKKVVIN